MNSDTRTIVNLETLVWTYAPEMAQYIFLPCGHTVKQHSERGGCLPNFKDDVVVAVAETA
jgi:hypothetical protein